MSYERAVVSTVIPTAATTVAATFPLKSDFGIPLGMRVLTTGDTSVIAQLADADGKIFYLDAAAKNYTTAIDRNLVWDDTATGLTGAGLPYDANGVATATNLGGGFQVIKSPITVTYTGGTAADTELLWFYYKSHAERIRVVLTTPNPAATISGTFQIPAKFGKILGFKFSNVTDVGSKIQIADADSRILYLDAADIDYHTAGVLQTRQIVPNGATAGLTALPIDATGAAGAAGEFCAAGTAVGRSPFTVTWSNNGTAGDVGTFDAFVERA